MKKVDITNQKFNMLTAIRFLYVKKEKSVWEFKCDCGNILEAYAFSVQRGNTRSCGCLRDIVSSERLKRVGVHIKFSKGESAFNNLYRSYKRTAEKHGRVFALTPEQFRSITSSRCYFCGKYPSNEYKVPRGNGGYLYNGIDRMDNAIGYILENCVPSCSSCNYAKRELTLEQFKDLIKNIYNYLIEENNNLLDFDSVLIKPQFSKIRSRKEVNVSTEFLGKSISLPLINSNMDTISSSELCLALSDYGCIGTLHRFWSIEENVKAFNSSIGNGIKPFVSIGIMEGEFERAKALYNAGAEVFILDVAHAANVAVVEFYNRLVKEFPTIKYIVGDFGTGKEIQEFLNKVDRKPDALKVGIGIGSQCVTRLVTGVGNTTLSCLLDCTPICKKNNIKLVLDGGIREIGDISKALIAGADIVMSGSLFAGCNETAGKVCSLDGHKEYRGSASLPSYEVQGKVATWRTPEGISTIVAAKGPVVAVLNNISGGLRSSCSYVNAFNLNELKANGKFQYKKIQVNV